MNIIGIGTPGCQIAKNFENLPQYKVFYIDSEKKDYDNFIKVTPEATHEEYEKNYKVVDFNCAVDDATVILSGAGNISGVILRLLEQLKQNNLTILYIKPDFASLTKNSKIRDKITFGVLQQYARSNLFSRIYVIDNKNIESVLGDLSISSYWKDINNVISSTYHMMNVFKNSEPLLTTFSPLNEISKIATFGVVGFDSFKEKLFYDLKGARIKRYFFGVNEETLEEDKDLLHRIREFTQDKSNDDVEVSFSIYPTEYERNYIYCAYYASLVQEEIIS
tara:strand:+ start:866 stop:1699 length:834 start_codon:yes stop_codon:yes gene_type:complete